MLRAKGLSGLIMCGLLGAAPVVQADAVTDWNEITLTAVTAGRGGPIGSLDIALVQIAVHDAVQALDKRYEPYYVELKNARGSRIAAVAAAAHGVLVGMYPLQAATLDLQLANYLADRGLANDPGVAVGQKVAGGILPLRRVNPNPLPQPFIGEEKVGKWRPTPSFLGNPPSPPSSSPMFAPWMAEFDPFTLTGPMRFRADPPPALTSQRYARDYEEVRALGSLNSTARSPEQTDIAYFYADNIFAQWNRGLRAIATAHVHRLGDSARLFALANVATADAVVSSWDSKKFYNVWRPVTAIAQGDADGNPATTGEPSWQPLINTPNYPDYTSGANGVTGAMTRTLALFFGTDRMTFDLTSNVPQVIRKTRTYHRFSDAAQDVVDARMYLGIHFRFADVAGRTQGRRVAEHAFDHFFLPCSDGGGHRTFAEEGAAEAAEVR